MRHWAREDIPGLCNGRGGHAGAAGFGGPGAAPPGRPNKNVGGRRPPTFGRGNRARRRPPGRPGEREGRGENKEKAAKPLFFIFII